eukprot:TRINITY_DN5259_c1_g1_i1.p1 TRINITY_DN5259_c1_g1~~TRINITY_DN5259_c1_g1_i1.p1  ORF type:complete len:371 (-),score=41.61 TRINITY_DN5259_c1_g1_i1:101-1213(-)
MFSRARYKCLVPWTESDNLSVKVEDVYASARQIIANTNRNSKTARSWIEKFVPPGVTFSAEIDDVLGLKGEFLKKLADEVGAVSHGQIAEAFHRRSPGGVDFYQSHVGGEKKAPVGSFGWHTDDVDAVIYVLEGKKRFRVAGWSAGSKVVIDKIIEPGTWALIPAGRFHSLHALGDDSNSTSHWVSILSMGLLSPNWDILQNRVTDVESSGDAFGLLSWNNTGELVEMLPERMLEEPDISFSDVNAFNEDGLTVLHRHTFAGRIDDLREALGFKGVAIDLQSSPDAEVLDGIKYTALGLAIAHGPEDAIYNSTSILLEFGADAAKVAVDSSKGASMSARQVAAARGSDVLEMLEKLLPPDSSLPHRSSEL